MKGLKRLVVLDPLWQQDRIRNYVHPIMPMFVQW